MSLTLDNYHVMTFYYSSHFTILTSEKHWYGFLLINILLREM